MRKVRYKHAGVVMIVLILAILSWNTPVWSETYLLFREWGGTWHDANKTYDDDRLMCWAASASNVLDWANWDTASYATETMIFQNIKDHWTDNRGWASWAWQWWLNGTAPPYTFYSYVDVSGGGNYFPGISFFSNYTAQYGSLPTIDALLHNGYGISIVLTKSSNSHAVTCWGFSYEMVDGQKKYTEIFITDSDDRVTAIRKYLLVYYNNAYYLSSTYAGWKITTIYGLAQNNNLVLTSAGFIAGAEPPPGAPIAPAWMLVGPALLVLLISQKRYQKNFR